MAKSFRPIVKASHSDEILQHQYSYEKFSVFYTFIWLGVFSIVVGFNLTAHARDGIYALIILPLCAPLFLYTAVAERETQYFQRQSVKMLTHALIGAFVSNFFFTHYFYNVLKARYTVPVTYINGVPAIFIAATIFFFNTYYVFATKVLRFLDKLMIKQKLGKIFASLIFVIYCSITAFAETYGIQAYPDYHFVSGARQYTLGSLFYSLYFIPTFIVCYRHSGKSIPYSQVFLETCGGWTLAWLLLETARLAIGSEMIIYTSEQMKRAAEAVHGPY